MQDFDFNFSSNISESILNNRLWAEILAALTVIGYDDCNGNDNEKHIEAIEFLKMVEQEIGVDRWYHYLFEGQNIPSLLEIKGLLKYSPKLELDQIIDNYRIATIIVGHLITNSQPRETLYFMLETLKNNRVTNPQIESELEEWFNTSQNKIPNFELYRSLINTFK